MKELQQAGRFRGRVVEYSLFESSTTSSIGVRIMVAIDGAFGDGEWHDWTSHGFSVSGMLNGVKKDGTINVRQAEALVDFAGWDGRFESIVEETWQPNNVGVTVSEDTYNDVTSFRINWLNDYEQNPTGAAKIDAKVIAGLDRKFGSQMRGIVSNSTRNSEVPAGSPVKPESKAPVPKAVDDHIPF